MFSSIPHLVVEAVSALQHADVFWTHVIVTDDAGILDIQLQSGQRHRVRNKLEPEDFVSDACVFSHAGSKLIYSLRICFCSVTELCSL